MRARGTAASEAIGAYHRAMRRTLTVLLLLFALDSSAATIATGFRQEVGLGGQILTTTDTAAFLTVPGTAEHAWFTVLDKDVCFGFNLDGTAPTPTSSARWLVGTSVKLDNDGLMIKAMRFISCATGEAARVQVYYTRTRRAGDQ